MSTGLGQVLDEIETDEARAARDEGGFVSHGFRPLDYIGNSRALYAAGRPVPQTAEPGQPCFLY